VNLPANEPALVGAAVTSALTAAAAFGLHLTADQVVAAATVGSVVTGLFVRDAVTPNARVNPQGPPT
jgi:hypothetical protein